MCKEFTHTLIPWYKFFSEKVKFIQLTEGIIVCATWRFNSIPTVTESNPSPSLQPHSSKYHTYVNEIVKLSTIRGHSTTVGPQCDTASCRTSGAENLEVVPRFLENLRTSPVVPIQRNLPYTDGRSVPLGSDTSRMISPLASPANSVTLPYIYYGLCTSIMYCVRLQIRMFVDIYTQRDYTHQIAMLHCHAETWKQTVLEKAGKRGKIWTSIKCGWRATKLDGDDSQMPFAPNGIKDILLLLPQLLLLLPPLLPSPPPLLLLPHFYYYRHNYYHRHRYYYYYYYCQAKGAA